MKQVLILNGQVVIEDIPAPLVEPGTVLVKVDYSCISVGTELSGIRTSGMPLWKRALKQPHNVKKVIRIAAERGLARTASVVQGRLTSGEPTGYSAAGVVQEVGEAIGDIRPGDRLACAGAQCAYHAEFICVPRNLTVPVPDALGLAEASTVTLGAIALQGVRRACPTLGESFVVVGLGFVGQLTVQILKANGCRTIGIDLDRKRIDAAIGLGMNAGVHPKDGNAMDQVARLTDGFGADGVIITAATPSDDVVSTAFQMCRKKGRVVLVGEVGLHLNRADFYEKEIDFLISTSYGPGRYERRYEEEGLDYPIGYVRWTENRNMAEYLRLLVEGRVRVRSLIEGAYPIDRAPEAYQRLQAPGEKPLVVLLSYPNAATNAADTRKIPNPRVYAPSFGRIRIALAGAGAFAKIMHLPNIKSLKRQYHLQAVMSRTGHNAAAIARQFAANYSTTEYRQILDDPQVDAVLICTRHNLHAKMALEALRAGKHVLVEKPLALMQEEADAVRKFYEERPDGADRPVLLTGFNRRFSPYARKIAELTEKRTNPMVLEYRMNAGYMPLNHWVHSAEGGGRNRGEACHIYDLFTYLTGGRALSTTARYIRPATDYYSARDNFVATVSFSDGSIGTLVYTALGSPDFPKENLAVFVDGTALILDNYESLYAFGASADVAASRADSKGYRSELESFARTIEEGGEWPISLWQQLQVAEIALKVEEQLDHD